MKKLTKIITGSVAAATWFVLHAIALAQDTTLTPPIGGDVLPGGGLVGTDIQTGFVFSKLLPFVIKYAIQLAIALSVVVLIIGGYQMMTSYGETEKNQTARKTITYALIGLVVALTAFGIVQIITSIQIV